MLDGDYDLADLLVRFEVAVRFHDLSQGERFGDDRLQATFRQTVQYQIPVACESVRRVPDRGGLQSRFGGLRLILLIDSITNALQLLHAIRSHLWVVQP